MEAARCLKKKETKTTLNMTLFDFKQVHYIKNYEGLGGFTIMYTK